ncbi:MAG: peptidylprolyl isomerase [Alphaproteobacteria bacterium]
MKESCKAFGVAQQGKAAVVVLAVLAVVAAGVVGFFAGKKSGQVPMGSESSSESRNFKVGKDAESVNPVVARVDGKEIKRQEIIDLLNNMPAQMRQVPVEQLYPMALEQAIGNRLADRKAATSGLENDPKVQKQLWEARKQIIRTSFIEQKVSERISEEALQEEYSRYVENFPEVEEVKAAHILVDDKKTAEEIIKKLDDGADFAELAREYSKDGSAERGGELGYFAENEVVPEFAEVAFETEPGTYADEPAKSEFGYHVVRVDEKRMRPPVPYEQVMPYIRQELERKELQALVEEWKEDARIERFDINGSPLAVSADAASPMELDEGMDDDAMSGEAVSEQDEEADMGSDEAAEQTSGAE